MVPQFTYPVPHWWRWLTFIFHSYKHSSVISLKCTAWLIFESISLEKTVSSMFPGTQNKTHFENLTAIARLCPDKFTLPTIVSETVSSQLCQHWVLHFYNFCQSDTWKIVSCSCFLESLLYSIHLYVHPYLMTVSAVHFFIKCEVEHRFVCLLAIDTCFFVNVVFMSLNHFSQLFLFFLDHLYELSVKEGLSPTPHLSLSFHFIFFLM